MIKFIAKNHIPESLIGDKKPPEETNDFLMAFNFEEAKKYIIENIPMQDVKKITAGLDGDFFHNNDFIYQDSKWNEKFDFFQSSDWATPIFIVYFNRTNRPPEAYECWTRV